MLVSTSFYPNKLNQFNYNLYSNRTSPFTLGAQQSGSTNSLSEFSRQISQILGDYSYMANQTNSSAGSSSSSPDNTSKTKSSAKETITSSTYTAGNLEALRRRILGLDKDTTGDESSTTADPTTASSASKVTAASISSTRTSASYSASLEFLQQQYNAVNFYTRFANSVYQFNQGTSNKPPVTQVFT